MGSKSSEHRGFFGDFKAGSPANLGKRPRLVRKFPETEHCSFVADRIGSRSQRSEILRTGFPVRA